jgi:hypothetical protein
MVLLFGNNAAERWAVAGRNTPVNEPTLASP